MKDKDRLKVLNAIAECDLRPGESPSSPFFDLLREFAIEEKIDEISEACGIYFREVPRSRQFITSGLSAVILEAHPSFRRGEYPSCIDQWLRENSDVLNKVQEYAALPNLVHVVNWMCLSYHEYLCKNSR